MGPQTPEIWRGVGCGTIAAMQGIEHYENFPVASWLCPRALRAPIGAIYHFARTADDLADEGSASPQQRLDDLAAYRVDLDRVVRGRACSTRWTGVFQALGLAMTQHHLPPQLLHDLLDAFEQDVRYTAAGTRYPDLAALLDYCRRSANPVGRLLLHLYGVNDSTSLRRSDAICSALQLINFWQDLSVDLPRQRHYLPLDALQRHGVAEAALQPTLPVGSSADSAAQALLREQVEHARNLMLEGAPLATELPGRIGWELRLVVQGGLRIIDHLQALGFRSWRERPTLRPWDAPTMLWRAVTMRP